MAELVNPATKELDGHRWTQDQADALLPELLELIDERVERASPEFPTRQV